MLAALSAIGAAMTNADIETVRRYIIHFLDYAASNPDAKLKYVKSDMHLWAHSDASYLSESKARSRAGACAFLGPKPHLPIVVEDPSPTINGPVFMLCKIIDAVMSSAQEAETAAGFLTAKELVPVRHTLIEMGHPQGPTPLYFDNKCATGIKNDPEQWIFDTIGLETVFDKNKFTYTGKRVRIIWQIIQRNTTLLCS